MEMQKRPDLDTEVEKMRREPTTTSRWDIKWTQRISNAEVQQKKYKYSYHKHPEN